mmetsp:Transcript_29097/g.29441  ORF Transcript_29097/g.29441 Transcript_29097/m.29441 type:complete len:160 (+) Transcript_29097:126-605(+)|eukprot:CAMPEP_0182427512 /NCGR_PEP_ID=MMETSP1167-20130531/18072_1 /TAXON_ID=2988 /ORGANISM="Mallomonas Sp, Strain CCMP3275" /LENGTH=159 /DNA_ID=CAMNT_0024609811 /DNA_START=86 /DNA_END=565 /DNA_ORIENTATION=+
MALAKLANFNWERLISKAHSPEVERAVQLLHAKANEIATSSAVYVKPPEPIDFAAYKSRLRFTAGAVDKLEESYKSMSVPAYSATVPAFESKKRALIFSVVKSTVTAAEADLAALKEQLNTFESSRFNEESTVADAMKKFPHLAEEIEKEITNHEWLKA